MGSTPGKVLYEYRRGSFTEKSVATVVTVAPDEAVEKSVAEDLMVPTPDNASEIIDNNTIQPEESTEETIEGKAVKAKNPKKKVTEE